jgi:hypothetical protein
MGSVVNTNPVNFYSHTAVNDGAITITFAGMEISIDGGYADNSNSKVWHHRNDVSFKQGERVAFLTENFNDVAQAIPVFERLRQLMGLVYSLDKLKQSGFTPNETLKQYCENIRQQHASVHHIGQFDYVRHIPFYSLTPQIGCK